jgi:SAM-dependent methyltransferase
MANEIHPVNFARACVVSDFMSQISTTFEFGSTLKVAILGGGPDEPEILALERLGFFPEVTVFGIDENNEYLDMNQIFKEKFDIDFDLILCSQVLEHIWCHENAFRNILHIMPSGSHVWLGCPTSNRAHAGPDYFYFSAGFTRTFLVNNLEHLGLSVIASGQLGTARFYRATHTMPVWLTVKSHMFPILHSFPGYKKGTRIAFVVRYGLRNLELFLFSNKITLLNETTKTGVNKTY